MATLQIPAEQYVIGGQQTLAGWVLPQQQYGFEEDADQHKDGAGAFDCKITYSRRQTLSVTLEAEASTVTTTYAAGGQIASGIFTDGNGAATAWKIRSAPTTKTRGPVQVTLDLVSQTDDLA